METLLPILLSLTAIYVALYPEKSRRFLKQARAKFITLNKQIEQPITLPFSVKDIYIRIMDLLTYSACLSLFLAAVFMICFDTYQQVVSEKTFFKALTLTLTGFIYFKIFHELRKTSKA